MIKRIISFALSVILITVFCSCCNKSDLYIVDCSNDGITNIDESEFVKQLISYDHAPKEEITVDFNGVLYHANYSYTKKNYDNAHAIDVYISDNKETLYIDATNNKLIGINYMNPEFFQNEGHFKNASDESIEQVKQEAFALLSSFVDLTFYNVENIETKELINGEYITFYKCCYEKYIDDFKTTASASYTYDSKGHIVELFAKDVDVYDDVESQKLLSQFDKEKLKTAIEGKISNQFQQFTYTIKKQYLYADNYGDLIIITNVEINYGKDLTTGLSLAGKIIDFTH